VVRNKAERGDFDKFQHEKDPDRSNVLKAIIEFGQFVHTILWVRVRLVFEGSGHDCKLQSRETERRQETAIGVNLQRPGNFELRLENIVKFEFVVLE
jgi:hypothetical protein